MSPPPGDGMSLSYADDEKEPFVTRVRTLPARTVAFTRRVPDGTRIALQSAWRTRQRGAAVFAGVFLASLVIATVLFYSNGLIQLFFEESLETDLYDVRVEFRTDSGGANRTSDPAMFFSFCDDLLEGEDLIADCGLTAGRQGSHGRNLFSNDGVEAQPIELSYINGSDPSWENINIHLDVDQGPPTNLSRPVRVMGDGMFGAVLGERHQTTMLSGDWPATHQDFVDDRGVILPQKLARKAGAEVGDTIDELSFGYAQERPDPCADDDDHWELDLFGVFQYCYVRVTLDNLTVVGIYDDELLGNPLVSQEAVYVPWGLLNATAQQGLIDGDHAYLALAVDRGQLPTESTREVQEALTALGVRIGEMEFEGEVQLEAVDVISSTIFFLNIILTFIQIFDYIIMIPIIMLSLAVLIYGLILSQEQRRREVAIHRTIGGSATNLQRMVLSELAVVSTVGWLAGLALAYFVAQIVLAAVGFLQFSTEPIAISPRISFGQILFTAIATLGLALVFGNRRTRDFLALEIAEGVAKVGKEGSSRRGLYWMLFGVGLISLVDSFLEATAEGTALEDGIISNVFFDAIVDIFGPFFLWVGGALVLGRVGAMAPRLTERLLGRTPLIKDVRRGLRGSGSAESVSRLSVIILLTLSIVTMAAVQGYTGTLVDERSASATVGADLKIDFQQPTTEAQALAAVQTAWTAEDRGTFPGTVTQVPVLTVSPDEDEFNLIEAWVITDAAEDVLHWDEQGVPGEVDDAMEDYQAGGFSLGETLAIRMNLESGETVVFNLTTPGGPTRQVNLTYMGEHQWVPGLPSGDAFNTMFIGETAYRDLTALGTAALPASLTWWVDTGDLEEDDPEGLQSLARALATDTSINGVEDWKSAHEEVERTGGLVFGTPGLLSLQFVVAATAAVASSFVFLTLVLTQRRKELAIIQAIGGSKQQVTKLVLFEIISIVSASMILGMLLGVGISYSFNGLFNLFGFIFQFFGGADTPISRELQWPVVQLILVGLAVLASVVVALVLTTRQALKADLARILKGE